MQIRITLEGRGGVLDMRTVDLRFDGAGDRLANPDDPAEVSEAIYDAFDDWILSPGDTIKIEEIL